MHYFSNKFSKIAQRKRLLSFDFGNLKLHDLAKLFIQTDCDKIELKKNNYDVISVTSSLLRHKIFHLGPQSKFLFTPVPLKPDSTLTLKLLISVILKAIDKQSKVIKKI